MTQLRTKTVTLPTSKAVVTVRESVSLDVIDASAIYGELTYDRKNKRDLNRAGKFADTMLRSTVEGLDGWASLDEATDGDLAVWANALGEVNKPVDPKESAPQNGGASSKPLTVISSTAETPILESANSASS